MTSMPLLVGSSVHEVLARHFRGLKNGVARDPIPEKAVDLMRAAWMDAQKELWRENPKRYPPLFELYYDRVPDRGRLKEYAEKARRAVRAVLDSPIYSRIRSGEASSLLWVDPVGAGFSEEIIFEVPPYQAISAPDLVVRDGERVVIVDWKTGKVNAGDRTQMEAAAAWSVQKLEIGVKEIEGALFYTETGEVDRFPISPEDRERVEGEIREDMAAMAGCLEELEGNVPRAEEYFPQQENRAVCRWCDFQEICWGRGPRKVPPAPRGKNGAPKSASGTSG